MGLRIYRAKCSGYQVPLISWDAVSYFIKKLTRNIKDYGVWISFKKAFAYALQPIYRKIVYYLYELDLNQRSARKSVDSRYKFKLVAPNEDQIIYQIEQMEEWLRGSFKAKLQSNCLCMVVMDGSKVSGFNYVSIGEGTIPLLSLKVIIGPSEAWSEQITISSDYRRQGLASALRDRFYQELKSAGITNLYGHRQEFNAASKASAQRFTKEIMVRAAYHRVFGFHRLRCLKGTDETIDPSRSFCLKPIAKDNRNKDQHQSMGHKTKFIAKIEDIK